MEVCVDYGLTKRDAHAELIGLEEKLERKRAEDPEQYEKKWRALRENRIGVVADIEWPFFRHMKSLGLADDGARGLHRLAPLGVACRNSPV